MRLALETPPPRRCLGAAPGSAVWAASRLCLAVLLALSVFRCNEKVTYVSAEAHVSEPGGMFVGRPAGRKALGQLATGTGALSFESLLGSFTSKQEALGALGMLMQAPRGGVHAAYYNVPEESMRAFWGAWKVRYKRDQFYQGSPYKDSIRYGYFSANVRRIVSSLQDVTRPNWYKFNARLDYPPGPLNGGVLPPDDYDVIDAGPANPTNVTEWDWRDWGKVTPAKDQGECAGCWAFAGVAAIESKVLIATDTNASAAPPLDLSEQQVLDCADQEAGFESRGCEGGFLFDPFIYASRGLGFLTTERVYPLTGTSGACDAARLQNVGGTSKYELADGAYQLVRPWSAAALREAVLVQPVVASLFVPPLFQFYAGGVWPASGCDVPGGAPSVNRARMNHAVLVVGFNMTAQPPYWIAKNSWGGGDAWGEDGFLNIEMTGMDGSNDWGACSMYQWMLVPAEVMPRQGDAVPAAPTTPTLRLMPGNSRRQFGRLEMLVDGTWSTICNRGFDSVDATVACRQLELGTSGIAVEGTPFGQGAGLPFAMSNVECTGEERALEQCPSSAGPAGVSGCTHAEDASVECGDALPEVTVRLVSSDGSMRSGRLEVYHAGQWGTVCDDGAGDEVASVVCQQLGLGGSGSAIQHAPFGPGNGTIWLTRVRCTGDEFRLEACPNAGWGNAPGCTHAEDLGIACYGMVGAPDTLPGVVTARLVGGSTRRQGRLEVLQKGVWRTVCADGADAGLARVVCAQLGLPATRAPNRTVGGAYFGQGTGGLPIYLHCTGREAGWEQCSFGGLGTRSCSHSDDVGMTCGVALDPMVRLSGGADPKSGRLEVRRNGRNSTWGTVCSRGFDPLDARVVCQSLGLGAYGSVLPPAAFGAGSGRIWMSDVACSGQESSLIECQSRAAVGCTHAMDVGIRCSSTPSGIVSVRLVNGTNSTSGRVEVLRDWVWGTVCQSLTSEQTATVICRQLGLGSTGLLRTGGKPFGEGTGPINLAAVNCNGSEARIQECPLIFQGTASCRHYEDIGVVCYDPPRPLFKYAGKWGAWGSGDGELQGPSGLVAAPSGDLFVCDSYNARIQHFSATGTFLAAFGSAGNAPGQLDSPSGIAQMNASGDLYVVNVGNQRIDRYRPSGEWVGGWRAGAYNSTDGKMGILARGGVVYLADYMAQRVQAFSEEGALLWQWGRSGMDPGQLYQPTALAMDAAGGVLYVLESGNRRVSRLTPSGQFLGTIGRGSLFSPWDMCLTKDGGMVVANKSNLVVFNASSGAVLGAFDPRVDGDSLTPLPMSIACSTDGSAAVYVIDRANNNVKRFLATTAAAATSARKSVVAGVAAMAPGSGAESAQGLAGTAAAAAAGKPGAVAGVASLPADAEAADGGSVPASLARMHASLAGFAADMAAAGQQQERRRQQMAGEQELEQRQRLPDQSLAARFLAMADRVDALAMEFRNLTAGAS